MPLLWRLGQYTLGEPWMGLGRYIEPTGAVESSRRNPQSCMEIPIQLLPAILVEGPAC